MEYPIDLPGGAQLSTISICKGLAGNKAYEPVVICPDLLYPEKNSFPFRILTYPMGEKRLPNLFKRIKAFKELIKAENPDLIHIEMSESLITYGFVRKYFKNLKYIYTDRGMYFGYRTRSKIFMLPVLRRSEMLITTTDRNRKLWEENSDVRPVETIYNTISSVFNTYDESKRKKEGKFTIGFAGRICIEKDWPFVPVLIKKFKDSGLDFRVELVLSLFEKGDDLEAAELKKKITEIVGEENFTYRSELTQAEMSDFYYGLDLFVMTSSFESFGKAAVEGMSRGCAVIATGVGGLREVVGDDRYIYDKDKVEKIIPLVRKMAEDREALKEIQGYFLDRYRNNFTEEKYIERHLQIYDRITEG
ncbi:MAG: glycosyltransferase family 4 protein [Lachnospiraceae bacterium]|nr:glycosyltransferase family 4 protein [Lachnospiraceae bacterium]